MTQAKIGYAAMLEQFGPREIVDYSVAAEAAGFSGVMAADHFQPWVPQQGQAPFVWTVMAAIGERTVGDFGPGVTCPGYRMHPATIAQASATLEATYPGRHWLGLGSGEALNEHIVGGYWPETPERIARMLESIDIIRKLFSGKDVKHDGRWYKLETTRLWTLSETPPPIYVATAGPYTAKKTGELCDGIITVGAPEEKIDGIFAKFEEGARGAGKDPSTMPRILQLHLAWAPTHDEALRDAIVEWPNGGMKFPKQDIRSPFDLAAMARLVRAEDFEGRMVISEDPEVHRAHIQRHLDLGFDQVYLHNVGRNQLEWIEVFGRDVLPKLHR